MDRDTTYKINIHHRHYTGWNISYNSQAVGGIKDVRIYQQT
ncbi:MAG: hypothetical protein ACTSRP_27635 [Candidatus Helarchaeota archaeon]